MPTVKLNRSATRKIADATEPLPLNWDTSLIGKYDIAGPRYTSYPTANQFDDGFSAKDYRALAAPATERHSIAPLSLYLHIPFCRDICYYCACNKVVSRKRDKVASYLTAMRQELVLRGQLHGYRPVTQLHWGGGTPTYLSAPELTELMHHIACNFNTSSDANREYSIEIDPRTLDEQTLALLKGIGFNRISMGVQDFDPRVQKAINRVQSTESVQYLVDGVRNLGFSSLSFDLIYGLPGQTINTFSHTIDRVVEMAPDRIALYNYAHLPERFANQRIIDRQALPDAGVKLAILERAGMQLLRAGYLYIGMDHFVKAGDELAVARHQRRLQRNFQGYSTSLAQDLIGIGPSAISRYKDSYSQNSHNLEQWQHALGAGELPITQGLIMSDEDRLREHIIMAIACHLRLDIPEAEQRFHYDFLDKFSSIVPMLKQFEQDELMTLSTDTLEILPRGRLLLRNICMLFDAYLQQPGADTKQRFSRTI